jgi:hypothetical protein
MSQLELFVGAYVTIVCLTDLLVAMNTHSVVLRYHQDGNKGRLGSYILTLLITGAMIILISGKVVDQVMDSEETIQSATAHTPHS